MLPPSEPDRIRIAFDDHRLVANAGLILPVTLAQHLGLRELASNHVELGEGGGDREPVPGEQGSGAGENKRLSSQPVGQERRGQTALPDGSAIKGRNILARLRARFLVSGKCASHLGFGLVLDQARN